LWKLGIKYAREGFVASTRPHASRSIPSNGSRCSPTISVPSVSNNSFAYAYTGDSIAMRRTASDRATMSSDCCEPVVITTSSASTSSPRCCSRFAIASRNGR